MKLRNKKTGEIKDWSFVMLQNVAQTTERSHYASLAELNEEWEDYEEPKEYWCIDYDGGILCVKSDNSSAEKNMISIGNHFESMEEAEKAVEKLKAWKRLKDKGFRFIDHIDRDTGQGMTRYEWNGYIDGEDLDLLFCTEEDD